MLHRMSPRVFLLSLGVCLLCASTQAAEIQVVQTLATFSNKDSQQYKIVTGSGVTVQPTFGVTRGKDVDLLELSFDISDTAKKNTRWFGLELLKQLVLSPINTDYS